MILASDTFNRTGTTLAGDWTQVSGQFFTDGSYATMDTVAVHIATLSGTSQANSFLQAWVRIPDALQNAGLIWRFQDVNNFYYLRVNSAANGTRLGVRSGGVFTDLTTVSAAVGTGWRRYSIRHVGNVIELYVDAIHLNANDGPFLTVTNSVITSAGLAGIMSTDSNAGQAFINDFIVRNGAADTIYVDTNFNGGVVGEGMGTETLPDLNIDWALTNCGTERGSTIKVLSTTAIGNGQAPSLGGANQFIINHTTRFSGAFSFPTYDDADGRVLEPGSPNLIIEGANGATRSTLQETNNQAYFTINGLADGIVIRGFHVRLTGGIASEFLRVNGSVGDICGAVSVDKCSFSIEVSNTSTINYETTHSADLQRILFCYFKNTVSVVRFIDLAGNNVGTPSILIRNNVFDARTAALTNVAGVGAIHNQASELFDAGSAIDIDHNTFLAIRSSGNDCALGFSDPGNVLGTVEWQNNIVYGLANPDETANGVIMVGGGVMTGTITAHHNGYYRVLTELDGSYVTDGGNEVNDTDPTFVSTNPATIFTWQHTAGRAQNGEGTFAAMTITGDFRPTDSHYVETSDDSHALLGVLDRGALQEYEEPVQDEDPFSSGAFNNNTKVIYLSYANKHRKGAVLKASGPISVEAQDVTPIPSTRLDSFSLLTVDHDGLINIENRGDPPLPMVLATRVIWGPMPADRTHIHRLVLRHDATLLENHPVVDVQFITQAPDEAPGDVFLGEINAEQRRFDGVDGPGELQNFKIQFEGMAPLHFWIAEDTGDR